MEANPDWPEVKAAQAAHAARQPDRLEEIRERLARWFDDRSVWFDCDDIAFLLEQHDTRSHEVERLRLHVLELIAVAGVTEVW